MKKYSGPLREFIDEILGRFPGARDFDPCPCGITLAVIPARYVQPDIHFVVDDANLRQRVVQAIKERCPQISHHEGPDAVLIMCEFA